MARNESYDEQPMPEFSSEAIDFRAASESFKNLRTLKKNDLETLELVVRYQEQLVPTVAGMILFGKLREKCFSDAWIQAGRFKGLDKTKIVDSREFQSYPINAIDDVLAFVEKHSMQALQINGARHEKKWNMPYKAVREAIINAVVHADYSQQGSPIRLAIFDNRIEIENPGLLPFGLTIPDIKEGISKLRNRVIGRIFKTVGLVERWGSGIQRIINTCHEGGYQEPKFEELGTHFRVTIYTEQKQTTALDDKNTAIVELVKKSKNIGMTTNEIAKKIKLSTRATRTRLLKLIELGLIIEVASSPQDPNKQYFAS